MPETRKPTGETPEIRDQFDPSKLSFDEIRQAHELAKISYRIVEDGLEGIKGQAITIRENKEGIWKLSSGSEYALPKFGYYMSIHQDSVLHRGTRDKQEMLDEFKKMIEELGYRVIE